MYATKKLHEILDKSKFTIGKIKTSDYLPTGKNPIIDQGKSLVAGYSNNDELVYNGKLPVIVYGDHTNIIKYVDFPFIGGADGIKVFPFNNNCDVKYCYYLLENFKPKTQGYRRHFSFFKEIDLPIPPLPTQKLIVQKLDSSFEKIDQSIELTRKNLQNIEELNKSVLEKVFSDGEYEMKKLGEICDFMGSGFACNKSNEVVGGYTHLRTHNIGTDGKLNFDLFIDINPEKVDLNKSKIYKGDILFNNTNSKELVGKTAYVDNDYNYGYSNHLTRLVINKNHNSNYISLYLNFLFKRGFFSNICNKWIGQAGVNNGMLKEIQIPLPPLEKQKEIVSYLDKVFAKNKELKTKYELQLKELEELKQSLLKDAFEGRLVKE